MPNPFQPIQSAVAHIQGFPAPWSVNGGWAIDLFLGRVTREHSDIEIGIYRRDQGLLWDQLPGWSLEKVIQRAEGFQWVGWEQHEFLELPIHQIKAVKADAEPREFEFFLNERNETHWLSRRHPGLMLPISAVAINSSMGIPILAPEIQLLFKAKQTRQKDDADFAATIPQLPLSQRQWLDGVLCQHHPGHPWIGSLRRNL